MHNKEKWLFVTRQSTWRHVRAVTTTGSKYNPYEGWAAASYDKIKEETSYGDFTFCSGLVLVSLLIMKLSPASVTRLPRIWRRDGLVKCTMRKMALIRNTGSEIISIRFFWSLSAASHGRCVWVSQLLTDPNRLFIWFARGLSAVNLTVRCGYFLARWKWLLLDIIKYQTTDVTLNSSLYLTEPNIWSLFT